VKFLAAVIGSLLITTVSAFGMYGVDGDDWIGFLTDGNQFRARMDQLGFTLGNGTIKGTFGFRADTGWMGSIIDNGGTYNSESVSFNPTVSAGIAYTSDAFGIGVGYNFTYIDRFIQVHTPVVVFNALNNNLRLAVPIQIAMTDSDKYQFQTDPGWVNHKLKFTGIGFNQMELRYYTGIDAFNAIRVYASYRNWTAETDAFTRGVSKYVSEDLHLQLRLYFLNTQIGNVTVNPYIRIDYATALKGSLIDSYGTIANTYNSIGAYEDTSAGSIYSVKPYTIKIKPVLSLAASSDIVSLYFEPSLGYAYSYSKTKATATNPAVESAVHALTWGAYAEMYVTPVEDLEWYFEMDVNGNVTGQGTAAANADLAPVLFETTTGITWYLPSLGGDTAQ
uniref:hypothetical protein n=1 Tax=uncultured Brachyspira sp. TaxID=221953 RepID=UPI0026197086